MWIERVLQVAADHYLCAETLARVRRPHISQVAELAAGEPAVELDVDLLQLDVLARIDRLRVAEGVGVGGVERQLVRSRAYENNLRLTSPWFVSASLKPAPP